MIDYKIEQINLNDLDICNGVSLLLGDAYGSTSVSIESVLRNTTSNSINPSLYLAAIFDNKIIGFNAFIAHDFYLNGSIVHGYQSCWTATSSIHRGNKIFQNIITTAHKILKERGAAFVFGFPNDNSYPLFTKKLNYREIPSLKWQLLNLPGLKWCWYNSQSKSIGDLKQDVILQNDRQLVDLKLNELGNNLVKVDFEGSFAWGVRRLKYRKGFQIPYFDIGGFDLADCSHFPHILSLLKSTTDFIAYFQILTVKNNSFNSLLRNINFSTSNCLIIYDLNLDTSKGVDFNFFGGVRDVFK